MCNLHAHTHQHTHIRVHKNDIWRDQEATFNDNHTECMHVCLLALNLGNFPLMTRHDECVSLFLNCFIF